MPRDTHPFPKLASAALLLGLLICSNVVRAGAFNQVYSNYLEAVEKRDFSGALTLAEEVLILAQQEFAEDSNNMLNLRFNLANMLTKNRKFSEAYDAYLTLEQAFANRDGEDAESVFRVRLERYYVVASHSPIIEKLYRHKNKLGRQLLEQVETLSESNPEQSAVYQYGLVSALQQSNSSFLSVRRMISYVEDTEQALIAAFGQDDLRVLETQFYLGKLFKSAKKYNHAAAKYEAVVSIFDEEIDYTHPWQLSAHAQLVDIYETQGKSELATKHCVAIGAMKPWDENLIEQTPLFRHSPKYPTHYARAGKEGYVRLQFDINESGFVINPTVIESLGGSKFVDATLAAIKRWRYAPKFVGGKAVVATDNFVQMDFSLNR